MRANRESSASSSFAITANSSPELVLDGPCDLLQVDAASAVVGGARGDRKANADGDCADAAEVVVSTLVLPRRLLVFPQEGFERRRGDPVEVDRHFRSLGPRGLVPQQAVGDGAGGSADYHRRAYRARWRGPLAADAFGRDAGQEAAHFILLVS
jgi:hypothetical protein